MFNFKDHSICSRFVWFGQVCIAALIGIVLLLPPATAEANFFDTIKNIYNLPKDVENLQSQYEEAKKSYDETKQQVADQKLQLEEQRKQLLEEAQKARDTEEQLTQQNKVLQNNNNELQTRLQAMEETVSSKDKWIHRIKVTGITLVSLVVLYFILGRLFRVFIWRRNNKNRVQ
jgi:septal ring factor EnvC (AmiA/AmiB activator)